MRRAYLGHGATAGVPRVGSVLICAFVLAVTGCDPRGEGGDSKDDAAASGAHPDLLVGYNLLHSSLSGESGLGMLRVFKKLTLSAPAEDVQKTMQVLAKASKKRDEELKRLRALAPDVSGKAPPSPIGDGIQAAATEAGKHDMLHPDGTFSVRFLFLQAQATRMISVIAAETAGLDPNSERKKWLEVVAAEYEGYHDDLIALVERHSRFKGDET
jgi:hypothetical protein